MPKVLVLLLLLFNFGPPFYWGFAGAGISAPLFWSIGMATFAIGTGWRVHGRRILGSVFIGMCCAVAANVPIYFIGRGFGTPARPVLSLTGFTQALLISALMLGGALLLRRSQNQSHAQSRPSSKLGLLPEVEAFKELEDEMNRLMTDEQAQADSQTKLNLISRGLPEPEFGRDPRHPIQVNGPLGEVIYLSNLRTAASQQIMFHRLGSVARIDAYETVTFDGTTWDILFFENHRFVFDSRRAPKGYRIATGTEHEKVFLGANEFVVSFPDQLPDAISNMAERLLGGRIRSPPVRAALERVKFRRPAAHREQIDTLMPLFSGKISDRPSANVRGAGRTLAMALMGPDDCWRDVCKLVGYQPPGPVATCEMAFARAAIIRDAIPRHQSKAIAAEMLADVDRFVAEAFAGEDSSETLEHYENEPLSVVAPRVIRYYQENVFPLAQLADVFAHRLSVPGWPAAEITPLFEEVAAEAERLMKISSMLTRGHWI
jgi:hypothetical protein